MPLKNTCGKLSCNAKLHNATKVPKPRTNKLASFSHMNKDHGAFPLVVLKHTKKIKKSFVKVSAIKKRTSDFSEDLSAFTEAMHAVVFHCLLYLIVIQWEFDEADLAYTRDLCPSAPWINTAGKWETETKNVKDRGRLDANVLFACSRNKHILIVCMTNDYRDWEKKR